MIYDFLAPFYDAINAEIDYERWADVIEEIFKKECKARPELVLDLGCGTGRMTLELARRGYDMTGIDLSEDMLSVADCRVREAGLSDVLFICGNMASFELYGTVGAITCCLDSVNYLVGDGELDKCLSLVHNYLDPDGLFLFDINTPHKFKNVYGENTYVYEEEDCGNNSFCIWQNCYDEETCVCDFSLTVFEKEEGSEAYSRRDEIQSERCYAKNEIIELLIKNKFEIIGLYSDFNFAPAKDTDERWYVVARAKKD